MTWTPALLHMGWTQWLIFAGYVAAASLCFRSWRAHFRRDPTSPNRSIAAPWFRAGACLSFLALNRLLGLDAGLTILFRNIAMAEGWYADRRVFQLLILTLLPMGAIFLWPIGRSVADASPPVLELRVVFVGTILLLGFMAIRVCSFHPLDELLGRSLAGFHLGGVAEFVAIVVVATAAFLSPRLKRIK